MNGFLRIIRSAPRESTHAPARARIVLKDAPLDDLRRALELVGGGGTYVDPSVVPYLLGRAGTTALSQREREILRARTRTEAVAKALRAELIA